MRALCCFLLTVVSGLALLGGLPARAAAAETDDQAVRYVNGTVITFADVMERTYMRNATYQRQGKVVPGQGPESRKDRLAFEQESLEQLTDEELMVEKAKSLKLIPDHDRVLLDVIEDANMQGHEGLTLKQQAEAVKIRERQESIDYLLSAYYDLRLPAVSPAALYQAYLDRQQDFRMPARARVLAIILRPTDPAVVRDLRRQKSEVFKDAQSSTNATIAAAVTTRLPSILDDKTTASDRDRLIDEAMAAIAAMDNTPGLDAAAKELVRAVIELRGQETGILTLDQCSAQLATLRAQLAGKGEEAFRATAKRLSQGPHAAEGGDFGWKSPGEFPAEVDQRVFGGAPVGGVSDVFIANQAAWLLEVAERNASSERTFDAVLGELELQLFDNRRADLKKKVAQVLRKSASIVDAGTLAELSQ